MAKINEDLEKLRLIIKYFVSTNKAVDKFDSDSLLVISKFGNYLIARTKKVEYKNIKDFISKTYKYMLNNK